MNYWNDDDDEAERCWRAAILGMVAAAVAAVVLLAVTISRENAMSMSYREATQIAFDPLGDHATTTLDCAERKLKESFIGGRDRDAYVQLANLKARLQRIIGWTELQIGEDRMDEGAALEAINRIANDHKV